MLAAAQTTLCTCRQNSHGMPSVLLTFCCTGVLKSCCETALRPNAAPAPLAQCSAAAATTLQLPPALSASAAPTPASSYYYTAAPASSCYYTAAPASSFCTCCRRRCMRCLGSSAAGSSATSNRVPVSLAARSSTVILWGQQPRQQQANQISMWGPQLHEYICLWALPTGRR
jgi:hypothetical protein